MTRFPSTNCGKDLFHRPASTAMATPARKRWGQQSLAHVVCNGSCDRNRDSDRNNREHHQEQSDDLLAKETAFLCVSCGPDADFKDEIDRIEQDLTCAYLAAGFDVNTPNRCEEIARQVHDECSAYFGREEARKRVLRSAITFASSGRGANWRSGCGEIR